MTSIQVTIFLVFLFSLYLMSKKKMDSTIQYLLKLLSFYTLIMTNVLSLPFFDVFILNFNCQKGIPAFDDLDCYTGIHILHIIFSILNLLIWFFFTFLFVMFFNESNPLSNIPFAGPISKITLYKFVMKMLLVFYFFIDTEVSFHQTINKLKFI